MSWTQADADKLRAAIATGASQVRVGDETVVLRSLQEMRQTLAMIERELGGAAAQTSTQVYPSFVRRPA